MVEFREFDLLSVRQAAQICGCSDDTIRRALADGRLGAFRLRERGPWKIPAFSLEQLIGPELVKAAEVATAATADQPRVRG